MSSHQHTQVGARSRFGAARFEQIYEESEDPWGYETSSYERDKYAATIAALPPRPLARALELGCSIGVFTERLAARCAAVVAVDFSARALEHAGRRLAELPHVELALVSFPEQIPAGEWDLIVCSEVLYYLDHEALARATAWFEAQLQKGASLVAVSWRGERREEPMSGDEAHALLLARLARWHALDARTDSYRLDRFDGDDR